MSDERETITTGVPIIDDAPGASALQVPGWQRDALCVEHPEVDFFPKRGGSAEPARAVCGRCLVRIECREYALELKIPSGVWGGTTPAERAGHRRVAA